MMEAYTKEEAKEKVLKNIESLLNYWDSDIVSHRSRRERMNGLIFSMLVMFDGGQVNIPSMDIVLRPHPEDEDYHKGEGESWFEDGMAINDDCQLHEVWVNRK